MYQTKRAPVYDINANKKDDVTVFDFETPHKSIYGYNIRDYNDDHYQPSYNNSSSSNSNNNNNSYSDRHHHSHHHQRDDHNHHREERSHRHRHDDSSRHHHHQGDREDGYHRDDDDDDDVRHRREDRYDPPHRDDHSQHRHVDYYHPSGSDSSLDLDLHSPTTHGESEAKHEVEYSSAPDTFPCGHVLCHNCIRKFLRRQRMSGFSCCPVCRQRVDVGDIPVHAMGLATDPGSPLPSSPDAESTSTDTVPISLLNNFDDIVEKFNGIHLSLRRLKDEKVQAKSMGMTYTNTHCDLCLESHGTLRVVQEYKHLAVHHERPTAWSNYFYRLQHGKVVTEFYSKVNSSCICVPCTYRELKQQNIPELQSLPDVNPQQNTQVCLAEVGKILATNSAPIMALQGKNVIEIDHRVRLKERADHFNFKESAKEVERMVRGQEEILLSMATKQIRDTGRLYHVKESNSVEYDLDETEV